MRPSKPKYNVTEVLTVRAPSDDPRTWWQPEEEVPQSQWYGTGDERYAFALERAYRSLRFAEGHLRAAGHVKDDLGLIQDLVSLARTAINTSLDRLDPARAELQATLDAWGPAYDESEPIYEPVTQNMGPIDEPVTHNLGPG